MCEQILFTQKKTNELKSNQTKPVKKTVKKY